MSSTEFYDERYFHVLSETYKHLTYQYTQGILSRIVSKYARKGDIFLDVGCGIGWLLEVGSKVGCAVTGIDISSSGLRITKGRMKEPNFAVADAHLFPFRHEVFDVVCCTWLLEHVKSPEQVLMEIFRVLKPKGLAIVMSPSGELISTRRRSPENSLLEQFGEEEFGEEHFWEFSPIGLQNIVERAGFVVLERRGLYRFHYFNIFTYPFYKLLSSNHKVSFSIQPGGKKRKSDNAISKPMGLLLRTGFRLFSKVEMRLGNKAPFSFFGIETLIVCKK